MIFPGASTNFYDRYIVDPAHASSTLGASSGSPMPPSFHSFQTSANSIMRSGHGSTSDFLRSIDDLKNGDYIINGDVPGISAVQQDISSMVSESSDVSGKVVSGARLDPQTFDYINSELAKAYGMDRSTAYQEALSNTAYQRAVKDMQAAGLNPAVLFGAGRGSSAGGVGSAYPLDSGSSFGSSSGSGKSLFSSGAYNAISTLVGLTAALVSGKPQNFYMWQNGAKSIMTLANEVK